MPSSSCRAHSPKPQPTLTGLAPAQRANQMHQPLQRRICNVNPISHLLRSTLRACLPAAFTGGGLFYFGSLRVHANDCPFFLPA